MSSHGQKLTLGNGQARSTGTIRVIISQSTRSRHLFELCGSVRQAQILQGRIASVFQASNYSELYSTVQIPVQSFRLSIVSIHSLIENVVLNKLCIFCLSQVCSLFAVKGAIYVHNFLKNFFCHFTPNSRFHASENEKK